MKFESKHAYKAQGEGLVINDGESRHEGHEGFAELGDELDFEYQLTCPIKHRLSAPAVFEYTTSLVSVQYRTRQAGFRSN